LKVKEKEIHASERPVGGFEKATRQKKKTRMTQWLLVLQQKQTHDEKRKGRMTQRLMVLQWK